MQGTGTKADPYIITTRAELESMASNKSAWYKLGNDIDLGTNSEWVPIGNYTSPFTGGLDGDGHVIKNLYVHNSSGSNYSSLLGNCSRNSTEVRNLGLKNVDIELTISSDWTVSPVGTNVRLVDKCYATGKIKCTFNPSTPTIFLFASGITSKSAAVTNSWSSVDIEVNGNANSHPNIAGIVSQVTATSSYQKVDSCYYIGNIVHTGETSTYTGKGLGGIAEITGSDSCPVSKAVMIGTISSSKTSSYKGRVVAFSSSGATCTKCYAADTITGYSPVGVNGKNGADVNVSEYTTKTFWEDTVGYNFTDDWYWDSVNSRPMQKVFQGAIEITVTGDAVVALGDASNFTATCTDPSITTFSWNYGDGSTESGGASVQHTYEAAGEYTVTASASGVDGTFSTKVIGVVISGNAQFANDIPHTLTASGTPSGGTYSWSDGETGTTHTKTYTGYEDGQTVTVTCTYTLEGVSVSASKTITCVKGTLTLSSSSLSPQLTDTVLLTTTYSGSETPSNRELKHSLDGIEWTSLGFSSPYAYTFSDDEPTTHYFKVEFTLPIEGVISHSITLTTVASGVEIISPQPYDAVFVNDEITFTASSIGLTDPTFLWSDGHTEASFTKSYSSVGSETMTVTATAIEGTFTASVTITIIPIGDFTINAPQTFSNGVQVTFKVEGSIPDVTTWEFPDGEDTGTTVTRTFTGYARGAVIQVYVTGEYIDDLGHSHLVTHDTTLTCAFPASYYENPRGEKFYFDSACKILRQGKSGFSEIQINTDVIAGHNYNSVSGLTTNNRVITMNIYVKGDYATMHAKRREMVHVMTPQKELGTFSYTRDDGSVFTMRCNISLGYPIFSDEAVRDGWVGTISFIAPNGVWEGAKITASTDDVIENIGDIPCGFEATLTGNLMNATNSEQMQAVSGTLSGYKIDTANGTVMKEVDGEWVDAWEDVSLNSTLVNLEVGNNTITGCSSVTFKPLYLGV